jgi:hypothetical protein
MEDRRITVDNKIPLTWLLTSACTVLVLLATLLWNVAAQSNKLDQLIIQADKADRRNVERDVKLEAVIRDAYDTKRNSEILGLRIEALEKARSK